MVNRLLVWAALTTKEAALFKELKGDCTRLARTKKPTEQNLFRRGIKEEIRASVFLLL